MKKTLTRIIAYIISLFIGNNLYAQVKPNTQVVPNVTNQTLNPIPSAYASGIALNYIRTWDAEKPFLIDSDISSLSRTVQEVKQGTQYFDGLGRPIQSVVKGISPNGFDMVSPAFYDVFGREAYKYLPYVSATSNGNFKTDPFNEENTFLKGFYNPTNDANGEKFFYSQTNFEASPLNRVTSSYAPGNSWAGNAVGVSAQYLVNNSLDSVRIWNIDTAIGNTPTSPGYYAAGTLFENVTTDEANHQVVEYKDKEGRVVLKKVQLSSSPSSGQTGWLCTYYIYDDLGNLRYVIQPGGSDILKLANWVFDATTWKNSAIAKEQCFSYEYDFRNRMIIKRVPGAGEVWMVYDARDRLVMTEDSLQRSQGKWLYNDYDSLNRVVVTGIWTTSGDRIYHQNLSTTSVVYPIPSTGYTILTQTYYDDYSWVSGTGSGLSSSLITTYNSNTSYFYTSSDNTFPYPRNITATNATHGMATGTKVNVLNTTTYLYSVSFYDDRARVIQTHSTNYTGGKDTVIMQYGFTGKILRTLEAHSKGGTNAQSYLVLTKNFYDAAGRLTSITKKTGNSYEDTIAVNQYDELGQLALKKIGKSRNSITDLTYSANPIDTLRYTYNIRGWLRGINKDYSNAVGTTKNWFGIELNYDYGFSTSQFNGNIAGIKWRNNGDGEQRAYGFTYDAVNRLTKADFNQYTSSTWNISAGLDFSVQTISYDQNGNILKLVQNGAKLNTSTTIDSLIYSYNNYSNKLNYVTDLKNDTTAHLGDFTEINNNTTQDYYYDGNGNLTQDNNKNIANIRYNFLNLPDSITVTGKGYIKYIYTAAGNKLQKIVNDTTTNPDKITRTDYAGLFIYQNDTLQYIAHEEGRIRPKTINRSDTMLYDFFEKDHLGNIRVVLTDEKQQDVYPVATVENNASSYAMLKNYYSINNTDTIGTARIASWGATSGNNYANNNGNPPYNTDPYITTTATSAIVYKLNGATGDKTGLGITLKVMTGDMVDVYAKSFWHNNGTINNGYPISAATPLLSFLTAFAGTPAVAGSLHGSASAVANAINNSTGDISSLKYLLDSSKTSSTSYPKASINWILFDEQFNPVKSGSGFDMINTTADAVKSHHSTVNVGKNGYLYVYASNESNTDVFFDNLQLIDTRGPLLETTNYYPFGLVMQGISSKAAGVLENKKKYNGNELQSKEFSDGSGLELYDFNARTYDQQVGRFIQIDPTPEDGEQESLTPYHFSGNNPATFNDPNGKCPWCWGAIIGAAVEYASQVAGNLAQGKSLGESLTNVKGGQILIAAGAGALSGGVSAFVPKGAVATVVKEVVIAGIGAAESAAKQYNETGKVSGTKVFTDVAANFVGDKLTKNVKVNSSSTIKTTEKQLRATRIAANDATSSGRAATVKKLETKVSSMNATNNRVQATAAGATANTLQAGADATINNSTDSKPVAVPAYDINKPAVDNTAVKRIIPIRF